MRVGVVQPPREPYGVHQLQDLLLALFFVLDETVDDQGLLDRLRDGVAGVEGRVGVLEDDLHLLPLHTELLLAHLHEVLALEIDLARRRLDQAQDAPARGALAAAGFAHDAERLALFDREGNVVHRVEHPLGRLEIFFQVSDFYHSLAHRSILPPVRTLSSS